MGANCVNFFAFHCVSCSTVEEKGGRLEAQKLMDIVFEEFFEANGLRRHLKRAEDCEQVVAKRTSEAQSTKRVQSMELRRAGEGREAEADFYEKTFWMVFESRRCKPQLVFSFGFEDVPAEMAHSLVTKYSGMIEKTNQGRGTG